MDFPGGVDHRQQRKVGRGLRRPAAIPADADDGGLPRCAHADEWVQYPGHRGFRQRQHADGEQPEHVHVESGRGLLDELPRSGRLVPRHWDDSLAGPDQHGRRADGCPAGRRRRWHARAGAQLQRRKQLRLPRTARLEHGGKHRTLRQHPEIGLPRPVQHRQHQRARRADSRRRAWRAQPHRAAHGPGKRRERQPGASWQPGRHHRLGEQRHSGSDQRVQHDPGRPEPGLPEETAPGHHRRNADDHQRTREARLPGLPAPGALLPDHQQAPEPVRREGASGFPGLRVGWQRGDRLPDVHGHHVADGIGPTRS